MSGRKRFGTSVCNSTATSPRRPWVLMTIAKVIHSPLASGVAIPISYSLLLFNDLQRVALVLLQSRRAQDVAQGASDAAGASNDFTQVGLGYFEFDDGLVSVFVLVNKNLALGFDDRLGDVFNHGARAGAGLDHDFFRTSAPDWRVQLRLGDSGRGRRGESEQFFDPIRALGAF